MKHVELTIEDGRRIGVMKGTALLIASMKPDPKHKHRKAVIRYRVGNKGGQHRALFVRDSFKQLLRIFPTGADGRDWIDAKDVEGQDVIFPAGSVVEWEQNSDKAKGGYLVTCELDGSSVTFLLEVTEDELREMSGGFDEDDVGPEDEAEDPPERPVASVRSPPAKPTRQRKRAKGQAGVAARAR